MYGKLINGELEVAPNPIHFEGKYVCTNDPTPFGYKLVVTPTPEPEVGYIAVIDGWEENEEAIVKKWRYIPAPADENEIKAEMFDILMGE